MKIAVAGLGRMGMQIARKLAEDGNEVIGTDHSQQLMDEAGTYGIRSVTSRQAIIDAFGNEHVVIWLMIPSEFVEDELNEWAGMLPIGSIVIDGGNSDFRLTKARGAQFAEKGLHLIDCGTSGGVWGYQNGFSMMIGCDDAAAFKQVESVFATLAKPEGAYHHFGPSGSGHYVKMVHNAIEYGMMESLAEGYRMLKEGPYKALDLAEAGEVWQHHSVITSWLNELCRDALKENPNLDGISGEVAESGEARWTLEVAKDMNIPLPAIQTSFDVRLASQKGDVNYATKLLAAMRNMFGGHKLNQR
jgi:6-phosphogluconate dehydrogenase